MRYEEIDWEPIDPLLGKISDAEIRRRHNISKRQLKARRDALGIEAYTQPITSERYRRARESQLRHKKKKRAVVRSPLSELLAKWNRANDALVGNEFRRWCCER